VDIELATAVGRLKDKGIELTLSEEAKDLLIDKGYNPDFGARPLRRAIQQCIEDPLSEELLRGSYPPGSVLILEVVDGEFRFSRGSGKPKPDSAEKAIK